MCTWVISGSTEHCLDIHLDNSARRPAKLKLYVHMAKGSWMTCCVGRYSSRATIISGTTICASYGVSMTMRWLVNYLCIWQTNCRCTYILIMVTKVVWWLIMLKGRIHRSYMLYLKLYITVYICPMHIIACAAHINAFKVPGNVWFALRMIVFDDYYSLRSFFVLIVLTISPRDSKTWNSVTNSFQVIEVSHCCSKR